MKPRIRNKTGFFGLIAAPFWLLSSVYLEPEVPGAKLKIQRGAAACSTAFGILHHTMPSKQWFLHPRSTFVHLARFGAMLYLLFTVFLTAQNINSVRSVAMMMDPFHSLNHSGTPRGVNPESCQRPDVFYETFIDVYTPLHFAGWFVKALILGDYNILFIASFLWEILEISLQFFMVNFRECWWDHWLLDFFGCNLAGIVLGMHHAGRFNGERYFRTLNASIERTLRTALLVAYVLAIDLIAFFLMIVLRVTASHPFFMLRYVIHYTFLQRYVTGLSAAKSKSRATVGVHFWSSHPPRPGYGSLPVETPGPDLLPALSMLIAEMVFIIRFSLQGPDLYTRDYTNPPSIRAVAAAWSTTAALAVTWVVLRLSKPDLMSGRWATKLSLLVVTAPLIALAMEDMIFTLRGP